MAQVYKDRGGWQRQVYEGLKRTGADADAIFAGMGVVLDEVLASDYSYSHTAAERFWALSERVSGDPDIGLRVAQHMPVFRGQVLRYLHQSSPTFGEGIARILRFQRLNSDAQVHSLERHGDTASLVFVSKVPEIDRLRHASECMALGLTRYFQEMSDGEFRPLQLSLSCDAPDDLALREQIFGCPVRYGQDRNRIDFAAALLARPSPDAEPELFALHERLASERMEKIASEDFVAAVGKQIGASLESGNASPETVAAALGIHEQQLATQLAEAETSFNRELDNYRRRLTRRLLARTDESIDEICYLTNFSEPSALYRAFKRWCGETPMQYRARMRKTRAPTKERQSAAHTKEGA